MTLGYKICQPYYWTNYDIGQKTNFENMINKCNNKEMKWGIQPPRIYYKHIT